MERDLTQGRIPGTVLSFALPFLFSGLLQMLYGMADLAMIGIYGAVSDTTAVACGSQVMHVLTVLITALSTGATVLIARRTGEHDRAGALRVTGIALTAYTVLSLFLALLLLPLAPMLTRLLQTPQQAVRGTVVYLSICFAGIPFITLYNIIAALMRGFGDTRTPLMFIGIACIANIALDFLFMGVMHMGTAGAALGTCLSQLIGDLAALYLIRKQKRMPLTREHFSWNAGAWKTCREMLRTGGPVALQDGFIQVSFLMITVFANQRGVTDAAAVGIVEKLIGFFFLVPSSMLSTTTAVCAQNLGAGKPGRALQVLRCAALMALSAGIFWSLICQWIPDIPLGWFTRDRDVIRAGSGYLRGYIWDSALAGVHFAFSGYFCASGHALYSFIHNALSMALVRLPVAYYASHYIMDTLLPMGLASTLGSLFSVIVCGILLIHTLRRAKAEETKIQNSALQ